MGKIVAIFLHAKTRGVKKNVKKAILREDYGLVGDAHAGPGKRQVSFLAVGAIDKITDEGLKSKCGGFGENITTSGIELTDLQAGTRLKIGDSLLEVTKIGKECRRPCALSGKPRQCVLPSQGIFARVIKGGNIAVGDEIEVTRRSKFSHY